MQKKYSKEEIERICSEIIFKRPPSIDKILHLKKKFKVFGWDSEQGIGTTSNILFQEKFTHLASLVAIDKKSKKTSPELELFYHYEINPRTNQKLSYFTIYEHLDKETIDNISSAKIVLRVIEDSLHIIGLNSYSSYRVGSILVQLAIEFGLMHQCKNFLLTSTHSSGQFWFKLGFSPVDKEIFEQLIIGETLNAREMYLSSLSLNSWKTKIQEMSILSSLDPADFLTLNTEEVEEKQTQDKDEQTSPLKPR